MPARGLSRFGSIPSRLPSGPVGSVTLGVLALTTLTAYLVTRARARAAADRTSGEVREVTWRFRSPQPIRVGRESAHRVAAVLDEIEELGQKLRAITTAPSEKRDLAPHPERPDPDLSPGPEAVVFARRSQVAAPPEPEPAPAPVEGAGMSRLQLREAVYTQARRLLRAGKGRSAVREATGLKLAEIDLLRCARAGEKAA